VLILPLFIKSFFYMGECGMLVGKAKELYEEMLND
jgi:hypothetical protein